MKNERRHRRLSLRGPVTIFVVILVLIVTLGVLWHLRLVHDYHKLRALAAQDAFHWTFIALGTVLFLAIIILASILGGQLISHIRWSQRQSNFMASVSHELNSPLSAIKLFAQTLRKDGLSTEDRKNFVGKILFDVERLQRLISNILRAAEVDNRGDELQVLVKNMELHSYLTDYIRDAGALKASHRLAISLSGKDDIPLKLDPMMFRQVLDNLIDNAVRYRGESNPRVEIDLVRSPGWVTMRVRDHGVGIAEENLPKLFDRFFRATSTAAATSKRNGTGIGLYVVRSIVQAHGGSVKAFSEGLGHGTTIQIRLPIIPQLTPKEKPFTARESKTTSSSPMTPKIDVAIGS